MRIVRFVYFLLLNGEVLDGTREEPMDLKSIAGQVKGTATNGEDYDIISTSDIKDTRNLRYSYTVLVKERVARRDFSMFKAALDTVWATVQKGNT